MKITIVCGSHRVNSESFRVGEYFLKRLKSLELINDTFLLDLATADLPIWSENLPQEPSWENLKMIERKIEESIGFIIVTPEWGGMVPPKLKNFFLLMNQKVLGHKPALITAISTGIGGSYPISELRSSSYKNTKICYMPEHLIIRSVGKVLHDVDTPEGRDKNIRDRIDYTLKVFQAYCKAFKLIRSSAINFDKYDHGM